MAKFLMLSQAKGLILYCFLETDQCGESVLSVLQLLVLDSFSSISISCTYLLLLFAIFLTQQRDDVDSFKTAGSELTEAVLSSPQTKFRHYQANVPGRQGERMYSYISLYLLHTLYRLENYFSEIQNLKVFFSLSFNFRKFVFHSCHDY